MFKINSDDDDFDDDDDGDDGYSQLDLVDLTVLRLLSDRDLPNESTTLINKKYSRFVSTIEILTNNEWFSSDWNPKPPSIWSVLRHELYDNYEILKYDLI